MRTVIQVSIDTHTLTKLDQWRGRAPRGQAIQRLLEIALDAGEPDMPRNPFTRRELQTTAEPAPDRSVQPPSLQDTREYALPSGASVRAGEAVRLEPALEQSVRERLRSGPWYENPGAAENPQDQERPFRTEIQATWSTGQEPDGPPPTRFVERDPYGGDPDADRDAEYPGREPLEDG